LAALVLTAALTVLAWLTVGVTRSSVPAREPPFDPGPLVGVVAGARAEIRGPAILLYVDEKCPWCAKELGRWGAAVEGQKLADPPTVVVSPRSDPSGSFVPATLRATVVHDRDGSIARALGVRAVPFRVRLLASGRVAAVHQGLTSAPEILRLFDSLFTPLEIPPR